MRSPVSTHRSPTSRRGAILSLALLVVPATSLRSQAATPCPRVGACAEVSSFSAQVSDFRTSTVDRGTRVLTATVRLTNRTAQPLVLGYVSGSAVGIDDQGNRYVVSGADAVRGIGEITANSFDPKFALRPGESADARFEFTLRITSRDQIIGTAYDLDLALRQIDPLAGNQFRLGREHSLHFSGFGRGGAVAASGSGASAASVPGMAPPAAAPPADGDQCRGRQRCYAAGTFVAELTQLTPSTEGRHHVLRATIRLRNMSAERIVLAYKAKSSGITDNLGNQYYWGRPGTYDMSAAGIGKVEGAQADAQFSLAPGEARDARLTLYRFDGAAKAKGTTFSESVSFVLLEPLPGGQVRVGREFAVSFNDVATGGGDATIQTGMSAAQRLLEAMRKPRKP